MALNNVCIVASSRHKLQLTRNESRVSLFLVVLDENNENLGVLTRLWDRFATLRKKWASVVTEDSKEKRKINKVDPCPPTMFMSGVIEGKIGW